MEETHGRGWSFQCFWPHNAGEAFEILVAVVNSFSAQSIDKFGKKIGFVKFKSDVFDAKGDRLPGIVFMRGPSAAILVVLECGAERYGILTLQARVAAGEFQFPEIPAGMLSGSGDFSGEAANELREETGFSINKKDLFDMTHAVYGDGWDGVYPSAGGCDEFVVLYCWKHKLSAKELLELDGKITGNSKEGEKITLKIVPLDSMHEHSPDMKVCIVI